MKAIVLCAGRGTRLSPLTDDRPKAVLPIGGKPIIIHILEWLSRNGVDDVLINLRAFPREIPAAVAGGGDLDISITYSFEPVLLGTAGTVRAARNWIAQDDVVVVYGDIITDQDLSELWAQHRRLGADATLLLHQRVGSNSVVRMGPERRITSFVERPVGGADLDAWVNSGVQILSPTLVQNIPDTVPADLPRDVYADQVDVLTLYGVPLTGQRVSVDSPERLREAAAVFAPKFHPGANEG
jgi:NDP-sugar pyrophosphorylase family protein